VARPDPIDSAVRSVKIFISSPHDVLAEREIAERVIARLDGMWGVHIRLHAERWERRHYQAAKSFQQAIGNMADFDLVLGILWKRVGSPLPPDQFVRPDGSSYESGTVFELESAIAASEKCGKPLVYLFHKTAPVQFSASTVDEDRRQHVTLLAWWERTVRDDRGHFRRGYQEFAGPEDFEQSLEALLEEHLREAGLIPSGAAWDIETKGSPFPGLVPYDQTYKTVFFGRALATANAIDELKVAADRSAPVLLIVGPSGSGKSSLARAGLMPQFGRSQIAGIDFWRQILLEPATDPILAFAQHLYAADCLPELAQGPQCAPESFAALAHQSADAAAQAIKWGIERAANAEQQQIGGGRLPVGRLLIVLDQLEILLNSPHRSAIAQLVRALVENEVAWVIATLRSDRYEDFQRDPDFVELRKRSALFDLPPPGASEIADIVKGPARCAGLVFEERDGVSLAKVISGEVSGADALPLLQMTLAQLFAAREQKTLTCAAYQAIGGLEGAIASHAERVFATVSPSAQDTLDALLRMLVADIDQEGRLTIRTPDRATLIDGGAAAELIDKMTEARLLVNAEGTVRIAHEALFRRWQRAESSPALQPEAIRLRRQIGPNHRIWRETQLEADLLQQGTTLVTAEDIISRHPGAFPAELTDYIKRSVEAAEVRARAEELRARQDARRARQRTYAVAGIAVLLAGLSAAIFSLYEDARHNFLLALLTRTDQYLIDGKPSHALAMASSLTRSSLADQAMSVVTPADTESEEAVRVSTIREITEAASSIPLLTLIRTSPANAAAYTENGIKFAVGYADGSIMVGPTDRIGKDTMLKGHTGRVWAVSFSPDGRQLASASSNEVLLWDLERGEARLLCDGGNSFTGVTLDPTGRYLAWSSRDGLVTVRDLETSQSQSFQDQRRAALAIAFSADGSLLASSGDDGRIVVRGTEGWSVQNTIETGATDLISIAFDGTGKKLAAASLAGPVEIWAIGPEASADPVARVPAPMEKRWKVRYSPDGSTIAVASWDGTVGFWDAETLQYRGIIDGNDERVNDIAFVFVDGERRLLTAAESGAVRFWDAAAIKPIFIDTANDSRETLVGRYSPDGTKFAAGGKDGVVTLYRVDANGSFQRVCGVKHNDWVTSIAFSPDGGRVLSGDGSENGIRLWAADNCQDVGRPIPAESADLRTVAFSPASDQIAWSTKAGFIWLMRLDSDAPPTRLAANHTNDVGEIDFNDAGTLLVSGDADGKVLVWNTTDGSLDRQLRDGGSAIFTTRFGAGGRLVAAGGVDDEIQVWDLTRPQGQELIKELRALGGSNRLAFNNDGTILAFGSDARYISMWSTSSWDKIFQLNVEVGVRSVFGFHPTHGDLAFDGENGVIRVLPRREPTNPTDPKAVRRGMDIFFDELPVNFALEQNTATIQSPPKSCETPKGLSLDTSR